MTLSQEDLDLGCRFFGELFKGTFSPVLADFLPDVAEVLGAEITNADKEPFTEAEQAAWAKLFYGVGEETVSLCESSWMNTERLQCQAPCLAARESYRAAGVAPDTAEDGMPEDHLALMLSFIGWQIESGHDPKDFVASHFGKWIEAFCLAVNARTDNERIRKLITLFGMFVTKLRETAM